ncbi:hypothetical protein QZM25_31630 [Burkholderia contaminans]|nr:MULTISPECIES: hypothetical protein [Burkholderia cepacia complex]MCA7889633.1 hypothetical protein [Burkholderia contaminans]MDN7577168.1 hypothetical protein [Burkholderia contaminans]MDN7670354.1 hypothetical protein [Burkholderia vietnamiensis]
MTTLSIIRSVEAVGLIAVSAWGIHLGKWRLTVLPVACVVALGAVMAAGY